MWSPPNFSRYADTSTRATIASATTPAAGTTVESVRSRRACAGSLVSVSTLRSGFVRVEIGFSAPRATRGLPVRIPPPADAQRLAVRHPALDAARAVGLAVPAPLVGEEDLVVGLGARRAGDLPG